MALSEEKIYLPMYAGAPCHGTIVPNLQAGIQATDHRDLMIHCRKYDQQPGFPATKSKSTKRTK
jgi:hypothetical protein